MPKGGHGGRRNVNESNKSNPAPSNAPSVQHSASSWTSPNTTIHNPPSSFTPQMLSDFGHTHRPTGIDILEVGYFWTHFFRRNNVEMTFVSPRGGPVALDPISIETMEKDDKLAKELKEDNEFMLKLGHTYPINWISPEDYDFVLIPGGHGAMFDLPEHDDVANVIAKIYENGGFTCAIGHGVSALLNVKLRNTSEYLLKNKRVACYSNAEEKEKRFDEYLPYYLEDRAKERGAKVETNKPFQPKVVVEDRLITAQSWPSIHEFVQKVVDSVASGRR